MRTLTGVMMADSDFDALGLYAEAGRQATRLALSTARSSLEAGRIPIAGAAVQRMADGTLKEITRGCNGRIPADGGRGYPTDHGETAAIRCIPNTSAVDWSEVVFATTLSPCVMCTRTLVHLHKLGLKRIVVAESQSFPGRKDLLRPLSGMTLVELSSPEAVDMMSQFSRTYPWDWAADIGEIPPADTVDVRPQDVVGAVRSGAAVVTTDGEVLAHSEDERAAHGGNPVYAPVIRAMGLAGSAVNLREQIIVVQGEGVLDEDSLGLSSMGALELFRPAALVTPRPVAASVKETLRAAGTAVYDCVRTAPV